MVKIQQLGELVSVIQGQQQKVAAVASFGVVTGFLFRQLLRFWRRRQLRAKIAAFRKKEENRRKKLKQRLGEEARWIIYSLPFSELMAKLNKGELKAVDVLRAYQQAALKVTNEINAVTEFVENAEETAEKLDQIPASERGPLHGIPFSVKECYFLKGTEATCGYSQNLGFSLDFETAPIIKFLQWLGAVPFAKTNVPQGLFSFDSRNPIYGITTNPIDKTRGPGGSTSGEGALISAKASPFGLGADVGGSLRVPSAWCGLYTLKSTSNRTLHGGDFLADLRPRIIWHDFYSLGFITPNIDTLVTLHRLLYSQPTFDKFSFNQLAPVPFREDLFKSDRKLTIAYCDFDGIMEPIPAVVRALNEAKEHLEKRGHRLVPWQLAFSNDEKKSVDFVKKAYMLYINTLMIDGQVETIKAMEEDVEISYSNVMTYQIFRLPNWLKSWPVRIAIAIFMGTLTAEMIGNMRAGETPHDVNILHRKIAEFRRQFCEIFEAAQFDALLWPAMPFPAVPLDAPREVSPALSYLTFFNFLNFPAGVCPFGRVTAEDEEKMSGYPSKPGLEREFFHRNVKKFLSSSTVGLPLAVQIAAPQFKEEVVLRLMKELSL